LLRFFKRLCIVAVCLAIIAAGAAFGLKYYYETAVPYKQEQIVLIESGEGIKEIAKNLAALGVLHTYPVFIAIETILGYNTAYKAGEFLLKPSLSPKAISLALRTEKPIQHRLTLVEGATAADLRKLLQAAKPLKNDLSVPIVEGGLLPDTYFYSRGDSMNDIVKRMQTAMRDTVNELWEKRLPNLPLKNQAEAVILASIVEKETAKKEEYGLVASVFINRLRLNMPLQSDPTVIYAITGGEEKMNRPLSRSDLAIESPVNTYKINGLPSTAIANPSRAAIAAVLTPPNTDYIFFVADGTGGHAFGRTLQEHNANVAAWRAKLGR
jgi:UPF0755 protein